MALPLDDPSISVDCLPRELTELITSHLPPSGLRFLFQASSTFGQQPTSTLATRLRLDVAQLSGISGRVLSAPGRLHRLAGITALELTQSAKEQGSVSCSQLAHTEAFLLRSATSTPLLARVDLTGLPLSFILAAVSCLAAAAPATLACLRLARCTDDLPTGSAATHLWPALPGVAPLRRLELSMFGHEPAVLYAGLACVHQLRSLRVEGTRLSLWSLPILPGLAQLELEDARVDADHGTLQGFSGLRQLRLPAGCDSIAPATLAGLTRLLIGGALCLSHPHVAAYARLVSLVAAGATFPCSLLLPALPALRDLDVGRVELPAAGGGVQSPTVARVSVVYMVGQRDGGGVRGTPQSVTRTFPRLTDLDLQGECQTELEVLQLCPAGPGGHMPHLRTLSVRHGAVSLPLAGAAPGVAVLELEADNCSDWVPQLPALRLLAPRRVVVKKWAHRERGPGTLLRAWPGLAEVELVDMVAGDECLGELAEGAPRLRWVSLLRCPQVTAMGVAVLLGAAEGVEVVRVRGCSRVLEADVNSLLRWARRPHFTVDVV